MIKTQEGVRLKPVGCRLCPLSAIGQGFCPDEVPKNPKIAMILDMPQRSDVTYQMPFSGSEGKAWQKTFIEDLGYKREDVLLSHCLRCCQPNDKYGISQYPREPLRRLGEMNCRQYDESLIRFDADMYIITLHPRNSRLIGCVTRHIRRDVEKAFSFAEKGYRPALLMGEGVAELYYPWMTGGLKNWRGHYWFGESPFKNGPPRERLFHHV